MNHYTTDQMIEFIRDIDPMCLEDEDHQGILEAASVRLSTQSQHIDWMRGRLALAEKVIGELYLMQREYER
jgi:hypothetical protein